MRGCVLVGLLIAASACNPPASEPSANAISGITLDEVSSLIGAASDPVSSAVGVTAITQLTLSNPGTTAVQVSFVLSGAFAGDWAANACEQPASCTIGAGETTHVPLEFTPSAHGARNATLQIVSSPSAGTAFVALVGSGLGGVLRVDQPSSASTPPFHHSFGTIPKGQASSFKVVMTNTGNEAITVTPSTPVAPYALDDGGAVALPANASDSFDVRCQSNSDGGPFPLTVTLQQSANTYERNTAALGFDCAIANTTARVLPMPIDFGELRVGDPDQPLTVTVTNPPGGGASIEVTAIALRDAPTALRQEQPSPALPIALDDGESVTIELALTAEEELRLDDVVLEIELFETESVVLEVPVIGTVGTPRAVVVPEQLALGSVCVGTSATSTVTMTNTGTATLHVQRPSIDETAFDIVFTSPTEYPDPPMGVALQVSDIAAIEVVPVTSSVAGSFAGTVTWSVDAPSSPFTVPVSLEFLASGTAVSPESMAFGTIDVGSHSAAQVIRLENCGGAAVVVNYGDVDAAIGSTDAWVVDPPGDPRTLPPDGVLQITVEFAPQDPGLHEAQLAIEIDGIEHVVTLTGNGVGSTREETSFYACGCSNSNDPTRAWPIAFAIALACGRRRRFVRLA